MKKIITSFLLVFMSLSATFAGSALRFAHPAGWEYTSSADVYEYTISNTGDDFNGMVALYAQDAEGKTYNLFEEHVFVAHNSETTLTYAFSDEIQLPVGEYTFFFRFTNEDGELVKEANSVKVVVRAPSTTTRIPITTTTGPGKLSLSTHSISDESELSVYSTVELRGVSLVNMVGQTVRKKSLAYTKEASLNVNGLSTGTYVVVGTTEEGVISTKMVKVQ